MCAKVLVYVIRNFTSSFSEKYDIDDITKAWVYVTFDDFSPGSEDDRTTQTIVVKTVSLGTRLQCFIINCILKL